MEKLFNVIITLVSSVCVVSLASCSSEPYEGFDFGEYNTALTYTVSAAAATRLSIVARITRRHK